MTPPVVRVFASARCSVGEHQVLPGLQWAGPVSTHLTRDGRSPRPVWKKGDCTYFMHIPLAD